MNERRVLLNNLYELIDDDYWISIDHHPTIEGEIRLIEGKLYHCVKDIIYYEEPKYDVRQQQDVESRKVWRWSRVYKDHL